MDRDQLFREATIRICGRLQLSEAVQDALEYLRQFIPAETLGFRVYDYKSGEVRTIARAAIGEAGSGTGHWEKLPTPLAKDFGAMDQGKPLVFGDVPAMLRKKMEELGLRGEEIMIPDELHSFIFMSLSIQNERFGGIYLAAREPNAFTEEHGEILHHLREPFAIALSNALSHTRLQELRDNLDHDNRQLRIRLIDNAGEVIGADTGLKEVVSMVTQIAPTDTTVLLRGETGVGKEVIAAALHRESNREDGPLISVNCGAISENLIESELFGHEKGSFTGADQQKRGLIQQANNGTLFLDEIAELSMQAQVKLLRFLQEKSIRRVGSLQEIQVNVRIIAATHRPLEERVREGRFREDLFFRLNVFPIHIPPLRERKDDLPLLANYLLGRKSTCLDHVPQLSAENLLHLRSYNWPGNVRELENVVERALILSDAGRLDFSALTNPPKEPVVNAAPKPDTLVLDGVIRQHIERVLEMTGGRIEGSEGAAKLMGLNPSTLRSRIRKLGIRGRQPA